MAEIPLNIVISAIDNASAEFKRINAEAINEVNRLKSFNDSAYDDMASSVKSAGDEHEKAKPKIKGFTEELKEASRAARTLRQSLFIVTATIALIVKSTKDASEFNNEAKKSFMAFNLALKQLSVTMGEILHPILRDVANTIKALNVVVVATTSSIIQMVSVMRSINLPVTTKDLIESLKQLPNDIKNLPNNIKKVFENIKGVVSGQKDPMGIIQKVKSDFLEVTSEAQRAAQDFLEKMGIRRAETTVQQQIPEERKKEFGKQEEARLESLRKRVEQVNTAIRESVSSNLSQALVGIQTFSEAWKSIWTSMAQYLIQSVLNEIIKKLIEILILKKAIGFIGSFFGVFHEGGEIPSFHSGGVIKAHNGLAVDEVPIIAQTGEGILSRRGMQALGGAGNLNRLNKGDDIQSSGGISVNVYYPKMSTREEAKSLANILGLEIERQLRYAR